MAESTTSWTDAQLRELLAHENFPRASQYDPRWVIASEMGPNALWLAESLASIMPLKPGMRVLDLGCGMATTSMFLAREFDVEVWAADLWINAAVNAQRIRDMGLAAKVYPIHAEARSLPFGEAFFDAIVSLDAYHYFGTDVHYLELYALKLLKPGGRIGIVSPASPGPVPYPLPDHLAAEEWHWLRDVAWWRDLWMRCPGLNIETCEPLPGGHDLWRRWNEITAKTGLGNAPGPGEELQTLIADGGRYLGFVRMVGCRHGVTRSQGP